MKFSLIVLNLLSTGGMAERHFATPNVHVERSHFAPQVLMITEAAKIQTVLKYHPGNTASFGTVKLCREE
ncbi:uncharacterized protein PADG_11411 [Paracoccidioides brasiliensis Pb18]|uniref:Uncharacterized protein n=1 Tax=Paracoccidioides brasiliensis (strain Pb18) TaxID=502780 RepID=A0A0A0HYZ4_PARBD|nr:uncharacterized protein PADG_11411 [Paracoccidioides brasiliensis Pb18]KGM92580.1 hypothetical protein PADG_11411 [Paracoccidioides brasiliensis Pb18]